MAEVTRGSSRYPWAHEISGENRMNLRAFFVMERDLEIANIQRAT